jgi:O-antigen/teichoic acid export membrane protein
MVNLVGAAASSLYLMPLIVHHLGDRAYGFWSLAWAFIGYYGLLDFGISSAVSQYLAIAIGSKNETESRDVFNAALRFQGSIGCLALAVTAGLAAATPLLCRTAADASLFWKVILILGINTALGFPVRVYSGVLEAELRFDIQAGLDFLGLSLRTGLIIFAVFSGGGLLSLAVASLLGSLPVMVLQVVFARRESDWARIGKSLLDRKRSKAFLSYSVFTFIATTADTLRFQLDPLVISTFIGLVAVTHYRIASVFARYYIDALLALMRLFQPLFSRHYGAGDHETVQRIFYFATKVTICVSVFICVAVIVCGKAFIARWMGPNYQDAYASMVVLALAVFLDVFQSPSVGLLYSTFKHKYYTYINLIEGLINLAVSVALAKPMGILGVAMGTLIGAVIVRGIAQPIIVCRICEMSYLNYMRYLGGNLFRFTALMGIAIAVAAWHVKPTYPSLSVSLAIATVIYAVGCWFAGFNSMERSQVMEAVRSRKRSRANLVSVAQE